MEMIMMFLLPKLETEDHSLVFLTSVLLDQLLVIEYLEFLKEQLMVDLMFLIQLRNSQDITKIKILRKRLMKLRFIGIEFLELILMNICRNLNLSHRMLIIDNSHNGINVLKTIKLRLLRNLWKRCLKELKRILLLLRKVRKFISLNFQMRKNHKFNLERMFIRDQ